MQLFHTAVASVADVYVELFTNNNFQENLTVASDGLNVCECTGTIVFDIISSDNKV